MNKSNQKTTKSNRPNPWEAEGTFKVTPPPDYESLQAARERRRAETQSKVEARQKRARNQRLLAAGAAVLLLAGGIKAKDAFEHSQKVNSPEYMQEQLDSYEGESHVVQPGDNPTSIASRLVDQEGQPLDREALQSARDLIHFQGKGDHNALLPTQSVELPQGTEYLPPEPPKPETP